MVKPNERLMTFSSFFALSSNPSVLFTISQDDVHVLVKSHKLSNHFPVILDDYPHPIVQQLLHFTALRRHVVEG